jgi:periplasmic nitrate reductase NapD
VSVELHVAGIIVYARPTSVQHVVETLGALPGAAVHATSAEGKLVVTLEGSSAREIAARIDAIQQLPAVLSACLVYQHNESLEAMMEEVSSEDDATGIH